MPFGERSIISTSRCATLTSGRTGEQQPGTIQETAKAKNAQWLIYPNPTNGNFTVSAPDGGTLCIENVLGQEIARYYISKGPNSIMLPSGTAAGMYTAKITGKAGAITHVGRLMYQP